MGASQCRPIDNSLSTANECGSLSSGQMYADPKLATCSSGNGEAFVSSRGGPTLCSRDNEVSRKGEIGNCIGEAKSNEHRLL
jgi:hypothetical protein